jgi:hypothetical protein
MSLLNGWQKAHICVVTPERIEFISRYYNYLKVIESLWRKVYGSKEILHCGSHKVHFRDANSLMETVDRVILILFDQKTYDSMSGKINDDVYSKNLSASFGTK